MENKLKGGKADKMTPKKIADKFDVDVKDVKKQIEYGTCVECEHTDDKKKAKEIAEDHVSEIPDYYNRLYKMEKEAEKYWGKKENKKEVKNETKIFIKKLLRENISEMSNLPPEAQKELQRLGINPKDVNVIIYDEMQNEGVGNVVKKTFDKFKTAAQAVAKPLMVCGLLANGYACNKHQQYVYKFSCNIDKLVTYTLTQDAELDDNLILKAGQQFGIMDGEVYNPKDNSKLPEHMQKELFDFIKNSPLFTNNSSEQYSPKGQAGSWYFLETDVIPDDELKVIAQRLAAEEETELVGKRSDYRLINPTAKVTFEGPSKNGDIETK
jgi:hypothetical protein